ncbi:MAG: 4-hydroxythreonine-4-phosphate dehydrogenase PdxA [candidate division KSB1 bacterium]|nr:4-hydroxythreonine-4-phosphate dehydrogenase PdxA [candidate division KSB1 bacterium]MDZ7274341.1 4-hydroxythreonine-4-phosphate dehydrogenase PdxA [candidate division KSB1 bacterium]MDZ7284997.1 4-hydroxythreonine-4-phosphate dehydrogenase PdxA [candidate division KSB1 bacterium]MDZ7297582.1 4-hydroxythreonine-4-phosphate dehydrogenase PdxA [candidate division KSB1 bacterium]MDZ7308841.1 4-hydroxythreonine-4-phosphate dehydrogenase PdxA [candidate division KSB1 bacterium]
MMKPESKIIVLTLGDINGIGPEVTLKALAHWQPPPTVRLALLGPLSALRFWESRLGQKQRIPVISSINDWQTPARVALVQAEFGEPAITPGNWSKASGAAAAQALLHATEWAKQGMAQAIVTGPTAKVALAAAGFNYPGQTEFIAERLGATTFAMMLLAGKMRVALVTTHLPLRQVAAAVTSEKILAKLRVLQRDLQQRFGIATPRIAVTGLNPHAGESGLLGDEEEEQIKPAIAQAQEEGIAASGPYPADALFGRHANRDSMAESGEALSVDAFLAMYHDQGLIPLKMQGFGRAVNYTAGLPVIRTSPDHGTAFDIAGRGIASPTSMIEALQLAVDLITARGGS